MLVRITVRLEVHGVLQVSNDLIVTRVFLQMCRGFLEMKCVLMLGLIYLNGRWCCWKYLGCRSWWGLLSWLLISNFEMFELFLIL